MQLIFHPLNVVPWAWR